MNTFLGIDVGNTNTVIGFFKELELIKSWRIRTERKATADELALSVFQLCRFENIDPLCAADLVISCVVPPLIDEWRRMSTKYFHKEAIVIDHSLNLGMDIRYKRPFEVGPDRLVNAIAGFERTKQAVIIIDYGTATTFDCVSSKGEYLGGAIAPGIILAAEALSKGTSRLPRVELFTTPDSAIGQDTVSAIQAGLIFGFAGLTQGILKRLTNEYPEKPRIIATGGLAPTIGAYCSEIEEIIPDLTMEGLAILYRRLKSLI